MSEHVLTLRARGHKRVEQERTVTLEPGETAEVVLDTEIVEIELGAPELNFWARRPTDPGDLHRRYHNRNQDIEEMAEEFDVSPGTVSRWMERAGLETWTG